MIRRLLSLFLAFVTILSLLPTAAFAASSEEDALGEVDIYNGDYELGYLAINGAVKKQKYTYFLYESNDGSTKESPAYCVNPNQYGVPQTVGPGESIKYLAEEKASDPKVVGIISNGYPHRSLGELGLENKYQAFYATKMALWYYLIPSWDISNLKVAPGLSGSELDIGNRILAAAKDIYKRGTTYAILRIASDRRYRDRDGNRLTDFISIKVRGPLAERCAEFAWKGCKLAAVGDFETISFADDPDRQPGFLIKATEVEFLSPRRVEEAAMAAGEPDDADAA